MILHSIFIQMKSALESATLIQHLKEKVTLQSYDKKTVYDKIIGNSASMQKVFSLMKLVSKYNVNVLIKGETGTGKEIIAKAIHQDFSSDAPFIAVNCAAIPEQLLESELFGYKKGAFTGAFKNTKGKFQLAEGGTIFLDEIGDLDLSLQAKLLRVIQEREITPIGEAKPIKINVRIITASHRDLDEMVKNNLFRQDLFFRLNVFEIALPKLNDRSSDIPLLAEHFREKFNKKFDKKVKKIPVKVLQKLQQKNWEGNVRQLENEIEKMIILCQKDEITEDLLDFKEDSEINSFQNIPLEWRSFQEFKNNIIASLHQKYIKQLLSESDGNITKASRIGKINRSQIYRIIQD